ncbi:hypothetical protein M436DRAFT_73345 [Aureobasidium namibiae CBS 147.97]|uniref:Uncharacterized protein n=1 Tax=Aureobasidium namibiae CBS 147.97 TaxID=1043004 RepID=A0A074WGZ7_9PEZI|nr:uncharacterized protein M436DRAFT_73345 [Aureobasidium namibiae CBS 147.97]KEQ72375.1 hypothetical protein M436DRAFT_73345 [Aureobasidium namibiae CBS 147.97]
MHIKVRPQIGEDPAIQGSKNVESSVCPENPHSFTLASQSHSGRRVRGWQRRAVLTLHNISERRLPVGTPASRLLVSSRRENQPFSHINVIKAEDIDDERASHQSTHKPYVSSSSGPSPKSSSKNLNSGETGRMSNHDSGSEEQIRLAELATARLERESKRIIDNDPTIPLSKLVDPKTTRNRLSRHCPDIDHPDLSDGDTSRTSKKGSPMDVHAKIFHPGSRDSSVSRSREPPRASFAMLSADDGDFQLVTNKKTKPSSRPAVGLNAHEVKVDGKSSAIAVSFNRQEINEVFGNNLPPLAYFQGNVGNKNGQVGFAIHPNRDISAQQWSQSGYQWYNIGQFSNSRRRTEGSLASHRLKGENELHSLLQHSLCYFRAVAKQQEAASMDLPFGLKELQTYMPKVPIERAAPKVVVGPSAADTPTRSEPVHHLPEKRYRARISSLGPKLEPWAQGYDSRARSKYEYSTAPVAPAPINFSMPREFIPSVAAASSMLNKTSSSPPHSLTTLNNLSFGAFSTDRAYGPNSNNSVLSNPEEPASTRPSTNEFSQYLSSFLPKVAPQTVTSQLQSSVPNLNFSTFLEKTQPQTASPGQAAASTQRSFTKANLEKIFSAASSRNINNGTSTRTVLHDPFQSQSPSIPAMTKQESNVKHHDFTWSSTPIGEGTSSFVGQAASSTSSDDDVPFDPRDSEPDYAPDTRTMEIVDMNLPHMTTEELAIYSRPSPQNFNGPFFMGSPDVPSEASRKSHEQELHDWFYSGLSIAERQNEHLKYIKTAHNQKPSISQPVANPGPIGTPPVCSMSSKNRESEPFNEYTQGPLEQRRGYLAPFCDPPEWCIDKSANGNNSFFGEDWSQPPERISRDARYRPLPSESKFGVYDGRGAGASGFRPSEGRHRVGSNLKY